MKYIIVIVIILAVLAVAYSFLRPQAVEYIKTTSTEVKEVEISVDALEKAVREAITASSTEIENTAKKAYDDAKRQAEVEIELQVTAEYREKIEAHEKELQKESVAY